MPVSADTRLNEFSPLSDKERKKEYKKILPSEIAEYLTMLGFTMYKEGHKERGAQLGDIARQWDELTEYVEMLKSENDLLLAKLLALAVKTAGNFSNTVADLNTNK